MSHSQVEQFCNATPAEYPTDEFGAFCHRPQFASRQLLQFIFVLWLMNGQFLMLQVIPDFLIWIPVW